MEPAAPPKIHRVEVEWHAVTYKTVIIYCLLLAAIILAGMLIAFPNLYSAVTRKLSTIASNEGENASVTQTQAKFVNLDGRVQVKRVSSVQWVDADYRTKQPHIFAVGDVIGFPSLGSVSMEQGRIAAANAFGIPIHSNRANYPYGIYTIPEISFIGKTEEQLTEEGVAYEVGIAFFREIARGQIRGDTTGRLKLIFAPDSKELLGVHIVGEGASELLHIGQAVFAFKGTVEYFADAVFNYPTLAECYKAAAFNGLNKLR